MTVKGCFSWCVEDRIIGYCIPLSQQSKLKSKLFVNEFQEPLCIIYDEYCKEKDKIPYLPDEFTSLMNLASTVSRNKNFKMFLLANNVDPLNQINTTLGIPAFVNNGTWEDIERGILYKNLAPSKELLEVEKDTTLYKITKKTLFHTYHYGNDVLINKRLPIYNMNSNSECFLLLRVVFNNTTLNIYAIKKGNSLFCQLSNKKIIDRKSFLIESANEINTFEVRRLKQMTLSSMLAKAYFNDDLYVDSNNTIFVVNRLIDLIK